jgi:starch-binding outer membrane protein, SusD/RagB family
MEPVSKYKCMVVMQCIKKWLPVLFVFFAGSCKKYLDVVPDNVATIDNAFKLKQEATKYLATCYSYLPASGDLQTNPALCAGDEFWMVAPFAVSDAPWKIAMGYQTATTIYMSGWSNMFRAFRDCNIFLDNIDKVVDMTDAEKDRWRHEVKFLKAYYHWSLFRMYGPIPVTDVNLPISATSDEAQRPRQTVDSVINYIASLLDEAAAGLPATISDRTTQLGHITKPIALAIKARVLVTAASPLFNGNSDYASFLNYDGTPLFNGVYDAGKWERAAAACKEAITACESAGMHLYKFDKLGLSLTDNMVTQMSIRNSVTEAWNAEIIWNNTKGSATFGDRTNTLQRFAMPRLDPAKITNEMCLGSLAPPLKIAELFYTENGVPINEDKNWDYGSRYKLRTGKTAESEFITNGYETAVLNFNREPRFYASLAFDGAVWYMQNGTFNVQAKNGQWQSRKGNWDYNATGYFAKKLVNWKFVIKDGQELIVEDYAWPEMRLSDLYLLYAEALNEVKGAGTEAYEYINKVRARAGLKTVQDSWMNYSVQPGKYQTKDGLRQIIQQERLIELALEGSRFWDLRRWKRSFEELNKPVMGWDVDQEAAAFYYRPRLRYQQTFKTRDYFWPVDYWDLLGNKRLVQSYGW